MFIRLLRGTVALLPLIAHPAVAQVQLDRFFPPAVVTSGESVIKAEGKFPNWPVSVVCDRKGVRVEAGKDSGTFAVSVSGDTPPGIAWVRVHDSTSASSPVPLLLEAVAPTSEVEPNNSIADCAEVGLPAVIVGRLEKSGEVDAFRVRVLAGQTLVASVTAHRILRSPMDAVLQLVDLNGNVLAQADDVCGLDPRMVYLADEDVELLIRLFAFPETPNSTIGLAGGNAFVYSMRITTDAYFDHGLPLLVTPQKDAESRAFGWSLPEKLDVKHTASESFGGAVAYVPGCLGWQWQPLGIQAQMIWESADKDPSTPKADTFPFIFSGHIGQRGEIDRVRFPVEKGKRYRATVRSREFGFALDSVLRLVQTTDEVELARNDDRARNQYDAVLNYSAKENAEVELQISDLLDAYGVTHAYAVIVDQPSADVQLSLAADRFVVKAGESVEIPVGVARLDGMADKLQVSLAAQPPGITAEPVVSEPKGDTSKSVKLKLKADKMVVFQGPIQILGHTLDADGKAMGPPITATHSLREFAQVQRVWLTVAPATP